MEKHDAIQTAPMLADVDSAYAKWQENHIGRKSDFYKAMTSPTMSREQFLLSLTKSQEFVGENFSQVKFE